MKLVAITRNEFPQWKEMRRAVFSELDDAYHDEEMENIFVSDQWYCYFLKDKKNTTLGLVELSSRNIVDGCLSSPVAYLEGLYLKPAYRGKGLGREVIAMIQHWCRRKGFSELATDTELTNAKAQKFYRAVGFEETYQVVEFRIEINSPGTGNVIKIPVE